MNKTKTKREYIFDGRGNEWRLNKREWIMCVVGMKEKQKMGMNVWVSKNGNEYMSVVGMKVQQLNGNKIINVVGMNGSLTEGYQMYESRGNE